MLFPGAGHKAAGAGAGGSIVLVSAALASHGLPNFEAMSAAKAGVEGACNMIYHQGYMSRPRFHDWLILRKLLGAEAGDPCGCLS